MNEEILTPDQAADLLQVKTKTLAEWRRLKKGPPYIRLGEGERGGFVRYEKRAILEWGRNNTITHESA